FLLQNRFLLHRMVNHLILFLLFQAEGWLWFHRCLFLFGFRLLFWLGMSFPSVLGTVGRNGGVAGFGHSVVAGSGLTATVHHLVGGAHPVSRAVGQVGLLTSSQTLGQFVPLVPVAQFLQVQRLALHVGHREADQQ